MNDHEIARARSLAYGLLADLLAHGLTPATREAAAMSAPIVAAIEGLSEDELGTQFERAFGWAAPPFEGAYLDAEGTIGGPATDALWALFRACGFHPNVRSVDVEHLATLLRALAFISGAEADAVADRHDGATEKTRELARRMLDEHVLRWVPLWAAAVHRANEPFPSALTSQIESLALSHRAALSGRARAFELPTAPDLLDDPKTGLREIGAWLSKPALSGLVLTRIDVQRIGRGLEVPRGFGERSQLLINMLRSAVQFEVFDRSVAALEAELDTQGALLRERRFEGVSELLSPWIARISLTRGVLRRLLEAAAQEPDEPA